MYVEGRMNLIDKENLKKNLTKVYHKNKELFLHGNNVFNRSTG